MPAPEIDLVFYDGGCGLCHRAVRFLLERDADGSRFMFAPLDGVTFNERVDVRGVALPDSIVVLTRSGALLVRSRAALHLLDVLGRHWRLLAQSLRWLPSSLLDRAYDLVARVRHRFFERPDESCPVVPSHLRGRFLP